MDAPNIGAKLLKRFRTDKKEPLKLRRHLGWSPLHGTWEDLGYSEIVLEAPHAFVPLPPNQVLNVDVTGDELRDARWLWCLVELSLGVQADPPASRAPDQIVRVNTGEVYRLAMRPDVRSLQSGLDGGLLLRLRS